MNILLRGLIGILNTLFFLDQIEWFEFIRALYCGLWFSNYEVGCLRICSLYGCPSWFWIHWLHWRRINFVLIIDWLRGKISEFLARLMGNYNTWLLNNTIFFRQRHLLILCNFRIYKLLIDQTLLSIITFRYPWLWLHYLATIWHIYC